MSTSFSARLGDIKGGTENVPHREVLVYTNKGIDGQRRKYVGALIFEELDAEAFIKFLQEHSK
jgi:hypothetical protein